MTMRSLATGILATIALLLVQTVYAAAQPVDLWTVSNIPVDGTGASPSAAKETALANGRQRAFVEVYRRLTPSSEWTRQPVITDLELEPMVKSFDITGEKHSSTRYLANVTYVFNPVGVRAALRKSGIQFSESTAKPVLVVPLFGTAWAPDSAWGKAWATQARRGRLVPVAVPTGDVTDMASLATVSSAADWSIVKPLADRYGATTVLVASAGKGANGLQVSMTQIKADGKAQRSSAFTPAATEDEYALANRAAGSIADSLQEEWKRSTSVDYGQQASLTVVVEISGLADWVGVKKQLEATKLVQVIQVEEMNMNSARLRLDYVGKVDQLQTALAQANLFLVADASGSWTLSRNAASASASQTSAVP